MASTAPQHHDDAAGHRQANPPQEDEDWSDSPSDKQSLPRRATRRQHRSHSKQPEQYRRHTSESNDPYMRQARNEAVPYGVGSNPFAPQPGAYQQVATPSYYPSPNTQAPHSYPSPYTYPAFSPSAAIPRGNAFAPQPYAQDDGYYFPPNIPPQYDESGYAEVPGAYDYAETSASYAPYLAQPPTRPAQSRPLPSRGPRLQRAQTDVDSRAAQAGLSDPPRRKKHSIPSRENTLSVDGEVLGQILKKLRKLEKQVEGKNYDLQSDPGRRRFRGSSTAGISILDDTRSLDLERQRSSQLIGFISRLLEDREREEQRDRHERPPKRDIVTLLEDIELSGRDKGIIPQREVQEIDFKLNSILKILLTEREEVNDRAVQRLISDVYDIRQDRRVARSPPSIVSTDHIQEVASPALNKTFGQSRSTTLPEPRNRQGDQYRAAQPSNQSRVRQNPAKPTEPEEEADDIFGDCEADDIPAQRPSRTRRYTLAQEIGLEDRRKGQPLTGQKRSEARPTMRRTSQGDQQRVRPGLRAFVQTEDEQESDDREPFPDRLPNPYAQTPPAPDPPSQHQRKKGRSVTFG
ncbi:hypothetical protein FHETE_5780 [Fusarium heterosporum]|uniref:Uncharacterized protein n=1 Tax=Fusarium heterosporum TaxID=42747 RepID=A0A8H5TCH3_FUSHE|nr:hypothetical protein FHETE_5780 [Fusarium heterosporum]